MQQVDGRKPKGTNGAEYMLTNTQVISRRVKAAKEARAWTWPEFERQTGITTEKRKKRIGSNPSPFTIEEILSIVRVLRVRPDYLLLGKRPILNLKKVINSSETASSDLPVALYNELVGAIADREEVDPGIVRKHLPGVDELFAAVQNGAVEGWKANFDRSRDDRLAISAAVRLAIGDAYLPTEVSQEEFQRLVKEITKRPKRLSPPVRAAMSAIMRESALRRPGSRSKRTGKGE